MPSLKHRLFDAAFRAMDMTKAGQLLRGVAQGLGAILMFHHVRPLQSRDFAPNQILEITPDYLDLVLRRLKHAGFEIIPIEAMAERIASKRAPPFAVLTFDDGAADLEQHALPVLLRHNTPFTAYAVPGFADGSSPLWWLDIEEAIARSDRIVARIGNGERPFETRTARQKQVAFDEIYWALRAGPEAGLREEIARLCALAGIDPLARTRRLCLDWEGLRRLAADPLCTIGAHTLTHPMLAKHPPEIAAAEIAGSKQRLESELQLDIRHFAYPVGDPGSASERDFILAAKAGFETAVTTRPGMIFPHHEQRLMALPRLSVNGLHQSRRAIDALLTGLPFFLMNRGKG
jgi:peptidoglycan/xylan/chitin deacetylase (PgdA/CDA1 family)